MSWLPDPVPVDGLLLPEPDFRNWALAEIIAFDEDHTAICSAAKKRRLAAREMLSHVEKIPDAVRTGACLPDISMARQKQASLLEVVDDLIGNGLVYWALREAD